jgi:hypothetical protein
LSGIETVRLAEYFDNNAPGVLVLQDKQKMLGVPTIMGKKEASPVTKLLF